MAYDGTEGEQITLTEAAGLTANYRQANPNAIKAHYGGKEVINAILAQPGCQGIRTYYGIDASGEKKLIMVGVDSNENDIHNGIIADRFYPCPVKCSTSNPLNS